VLAAVLIRNARAVAIRLARGTRACPGRARRAGRTDVAAGAAVVVIARQVDTRAVRAAHEPSAAHVRALACGACPLGCTGRQHPRRAVVPASTAVRQIRTQIDTRAVARHLTGGAGARAVRALLAAATGVA